jgi:RNA polymerase sigma-70 factor (ECF subfamily)
MTLNATTQIADPAVADLMIRARAGEVSAFEELVQPFCRPVMAFLYRFVDDAARAEDLAVGIFARLYRERYSYAKSRDLETWIYRGVVEMLRQQNTLQKTSTARDAGNALARFVRALNEQQRIALLLHKYQGLKIPQIAEVLNVCERDAKAVLRHAYQELTRMLHEQASTGQNAR